MSMTRQAKEEMVSFLEDRFSQAKAGLVVNYQGLDVAQVNEIRQEFREAKVEYKVVKNTLVRRALKGTAREPLAEAFSGPIAIALKYDEEYGKLGKAAKALKKKFEKFEFKAGFIEDDILDGDFVETMAKLPTLDEARAQLLGIVNAPAAKLLAQINAPASHVIGVIKAKSEKDAA